MPSTPGRRAVVEDRGEDVAAEPPRSNDDYPWDRFDPTWYVKEHYGHLLDDDRRILQIVRDFLVKEVGGDRARGIDAGAGANLYPTLAMLPFCRQVTLYERGKANVDWLRKEIKKPSASWREFWDVLASRDRYDKIERPGEVLTARAAVRQGNIFELPARQWDIGTMFFVAESISDQKREFRDATHRFVGSLKSGAPFAAAFMKNSVGYYVGPLRFPAVPVDEAAVSYCLSSVAYDVKVVSVRSENPWSWREKYDGMILAFGKAGGPGGKVGRKRG
jgi:NNMT/PNMT/TEMT family